MITNPQVGSRVRVCSNYVYSEFRYKEGSITALLYDGMIAVSLDREIRSYSDWSFHALDLNSCVPTPEEEDQQRRKQHADKYL